MATGEREGPTAQDAGRRSRTWHHARFPLTNEERRAVLILMLLALLGLAAKLWHMARPRTDASARPPPPHAVR